MTERASHTLVKALRGVPDFASLNDRTLLQIVGASVNLFWRRGSVVFSEGTPSDALYIVLSGEVRIVEPGEEDGAEVSRAGPGESFGELSLMLRTTHTKMARAVEDSELMVVPEESFHELLEASPDLAALFQRRLRERMAVTGDVSESA